LINDFRIPESIIYVMRLTGELQIGNLGDKYLGLRQMAREACRQTRRAIRVCGTPDATRA
jgi:hypothetical protein